MTFPEVLMLKLRQSSFDGMCSEADPRQLGRGTPGDREQVGTCCKVDIGNVKYRYYNITM